MIEQSILAILGLGSRLAVHFIKMRLLSKEDSIRLIPTIEGLSLGCH